MLLTTKNFSSDKIRLTKFDDPAVLLNCSKVVKSHFVVVGQRGKAKIQGLANSSCSPNLAETLAHLTVSATGLISIPVRSPLGDISADGTEKFPAAASTRISCLPKIHPP
ncbi:hypothetical protein LguiA_021504 [Lonicera macranthoides]